MSTPFITFNQESKDYTQNHNVRAWIRQALRGYETKRDENKNRFASWSSARDAASKIKEDAIDHLDSYLEEFEKKITERGTQVHWCSTPGDAKSALLGIAQKSNAKLIIKSKTMTGEEIHLNEALEHAGYQVIESDLGEYIVQLRQEPPYHIVFPAMHLKRDQVSKIFEEKLGTPPTDQPEELTMIARDTLRLKYLQADIGITGVNFAVAETGMISITENEGNARLTNALPRIHIAIMGIEKVLPKLQDLALFLPMLATAGAGQHLTGYNTLISGPRQEGEIDGPDEFHLIILDNGRTSLLADPEQRDALHCIRCGACLNVCPIFKNIGGHTYQTTYQGPIGSVITPHFKGLKLWKHLSYASSLCGACSEACPVKIDLHHHLLRNRRNSTNAGSSLMEKLIFRGFTWVSRSPFLFHFGSKIGRMAQAFLPFLFALPVPILKEWTRSRDLPPPPKRSFKELWSK